MTVAARRVAVEVEFGSVVEAFRSDDQHAVVARRDGDMGRQVNRRRHHKAIVIIGMLANQVDATRRAEDARRRAEGDLKLLLKFCRVIHRRYHTLTGPLRETARKRRGDTATRRHGECSVLSLCLRACVFNPRARY